MESISWSGTTLAELSLSNIAAQPGLGVYRLSFTFDLLFYAPAEAGKDISITLAADMNFGTAKTASYVGRLELLNGPLLLAASRPRPTHEYPVLYADLARGQLEAIEEIRLGEALRVDMSLAGLVLGGREAMRIQQPFSVPIPQSNWLAMLDQWKFGKHLVVEIPVPEDVPESLNKAFGPLAKVEDAIRKGEYRMSVGLVREVLDALESRLGPAQIDPDFKPLFAKAATLDKQARLDLLRRALWFMTSAAHHSDHVTTEFDWNRQDAVGILAMIIGLLQMER